MVSRHSSFSILNSSFCIHPPALHPFTVAVESDRPESENELPVAENGLPAVENRLPAVENDLAALDLDPQPRVKHPCELVQHLGGGANGLGECSVICILDVYDLLFRSGLSN